MINPPNFDFFKTSMLSKDIFKGFIQRMFITDTLIFFFLSSVDAFNASNLVIEIAKITKSDFW